VAARPVRAAAPVNRASGAGGVACSGRRDALNCPLFEAYWIGRVARDDDPRQQKPTDDVYRFIVRMEYGSYQSFTQNTNTGFRVGDRVRIDNGAMQRY
jgi:hypothetical protein